MEELFLYYHVITNSIKSIKMFNPLYIVFIICIIIIHFHIILKLCHWINTYTYLLLDKCLFHCNFLLL